MIKNICRFTDLDCLADGHQTLVKECISGSKNAIMLMRKGITTLFTMCVKSLSSSR